ncbi:MAG: DHHA1 domain-containing protein [Calditrichota bacterium]
MIKKGIKAGSIVREIGKALGGGGGGRPHQATAGGRDAGKLDEVLENIREYLPKVQ